MHQFSHTESLLELNATGTPVQTAGASTFQPAKSGTCSISHIPTAIKWENAHRIDRLALGNLFYQIYLGVIITCHKFIVETFKTYGTDINITGLTDLASFFNTYKINFLPIKTQKKSS